MFRRKFIASLTLAGVGELSAIENRRVTYEVKGFTCITCAVGLDTLLSRQQGVVHCKSSYADATTIIEFKPALVTEAVLRSYISEMGFAATEIKNA